MYANVFVIRQFKFKQTNVFLAPDTPFILGKEVNREMLIIKTTLNLPAFLFAALPLSIDIPIPLCLIVPDGLMCDVTGNSRLTLLIEISPVRHAGTKGSCYRWFHAPSISTRHDHLGHAFSGILPPPTLREHVDISNPRRRDNNGNDTSPRRSPSPFPGVVVAVEKGTRRALSGC